MKKYYYFIGILSLLLLITTLSACSKTGDSTLYTNDDHGFRIEFPESWAEEFEVLPYDYGLVISSKVNEIETLAYIHTYTIKEWQDLNEGADLPVQSQVIGDNEEEIVVLIYPGDVNYN